MTKKEIAKKLTQMKKALKGREPTPAEIRLAGALLDELDSLEAVQGKETRSFTFEIESRDEGERTVKASISSEYPVERFDGTEILIHTPAAIDLSRAPLPLLVGHDHSEINVGLVEGLRIVGKKLRGTLRFGKSARALELWDDIKAGIIRSLSVSYSVIERTVKDGTIYVMRWQPLECSLVAVAADPSVGINRAANSGRRKIMEDERNIDTMSIEDVEHELAQKRTLQAVQGQPYQPKTETGFRSMGEWFQAVQRAHSGSGMDDRLTRAVAGLSEGVGADGGFALSPQYTSDIMTNVWQQGEIMKRCYQVPMKSNSLIMPGVDETSRADGSRAGGIRGYWIAEGGTKTQSQPKFRRIELNLRKAVVLIPTTDELLDDANALDAFIRSEAEREIKFTIENSLFNGSGVAQPLGILNAGATVEVTKQGGQAAGTIVYENILDMYARIREDANAAFFCDRSCIPQLATMSLSVGTGGSSVWMPANGAAGQPYNELLGIPVVIHEHGATVGTVGDIVLADLSKYVLAYKPLQSEMSIHVYFETDQSLFRFVMRVDGQPKLASPITPKSTGDTVSDFVTLESRT